MYTELVPLQVAEPENTIYWFTSELGNWLTADTLREPLPHTDASDELSPQQLNPTWRGNFLSSPQDTGTVFRRLVFHFFKGSRFVSLFLIY